MPDHSVVAWIELYETEVSWATMFCFDNASSEKSCFVCDLVIFISQWIYEYMPPEGSEIFHRKERFFSFPVRL